MHKICLLVEGDVRQVDHAIAREENLLVKVVHVDPPPWNHFPRRLRPSHEQTATSTPNGSYLIIVLIVRISKSVHLVKSTVTLDCNVWQRTLSPY